MFKGGTQWLFLFFPLFLRFHMYRCIFRVLLYSEKQRVGVSIENRRMIANHLPANIALPFAGLRLVFTIPSKNLIEQFSIIELRAGKLFIICIRFCSSHRSWRSVTFLFFFYNSNSFLLSFSVFVLFSFLICKQLRTLRASETQKN